MTSIALDQLKSMLENTDRKDRGLPIESPLSEVDPDWETDFYARIDKTLKSGQAPDPAMRDVLITRYRNMRLQFMQDEANNVRPGRKASTKKPSAPPDPSREMSF